MSPTIVLWKWHDARYRERYEAVHVNVMRDMIERYMAGVRIICVTDDPAGVKGETFPLWDDCAAVGNPSGKHMPSCYRRLKLFDPATQEAMGIGPESVIVSLDLDTVITADPAPLWDRKEPFVGFLVPGTAQRYCFNGTMFLFRARTHAHLWTDFDPETSPEATRRTGFFGSDQGWLSWKLAKTAACWLPADGLLSYSRDVRHKGLPDHARIVSFHGRRKPWHERVRNEAPWVRRHWVWPKERKAG